MKYLYISIFLCHVVILNAAGQDLFVKQAKITYEKVIKPETKFEGAQMDFMNAGLNSTWSLTFSTKSSLYKTVPINDESSIVRAMINPNLKDEFYTDYEKSMRIRKKMVAKEAYLLEDSIPHLEWKLLSDVREIAGYECRKALTRINDTVYVVAFYTDRILLKGGPEGFNGLPGMILGLAIPRFRTTWFASKVELNAVDPKDLIPPAGKKKNLDELIPIIRQASQGANSPSSSIQPEQIKRELSGARL